MAVFNLISEFKPAGDQPQAIAKLTEGVLSGKRHQVLLGVTGSGKTFSMANLIANVGKPTLVIAPNKTLAAQLYSEFGVKLQQWKRRGLGYNLEIDSPV